MHLVFTPFTSEGSAEPVVAADATSVIISDTVSNVGFGGKWTMPGSSGAFTAPGNVLHSSGTE